MDSKELERVIEGVLAEAKKKKDKAKKSQEKERPDGYAYLEAYDFSAPLGAYNLYRSQGVVNWGPQTGAGTKIDDRVTGKKGAITESSGVWERALMLVEKKEKGNV